MLAGPVAVVAGITYNFLPFTALPLYVSLERIDKGLVEAAKDLYASKFQAFRKVVLPLSFPGLFAALVLTFVPATGDYVNSSVLGSNRTTMVGQVIQTKFVTEADYPEAAALSVILMVGMLVIALAYARCLEPRTRRAGGGGRMSAVVADRATAIERPPLRTKRKRWTAYILPVFTVAMIVYLASPVFIMILFSFNDLIGERQIAEFTCCTMKWWQEMLAIPALNEALRTSILVAIRRRSSPPCSAR